MPCENHGSKCDGKECYNKNLDNGLNSPFEIDIKGFEQLFFSN